MKALLQQALDALEWYVGEDDVIECMEGNEPWVKCKRNAEAVIEALRAELAKPEPVPVAWMLGHRLYDSLKDAEFDWRHDSAFDNAEITGG